MALHVGNRSWKEEEEEPDVCRQKALDGGKSVKPSAG